MWWIIFTYCYFFFIVTFFLLALYFIYLSLSNIFSFASLIKVDYSISLFVIYYNYIYLNYLQQRVSMIASASFAHFCSLLLCHVLGKLTWSSIRAAVVIRSLGEHGKLTDDEIWVCVCVCFFLSFFLCVCVFVCVYVSE